MPPIVHSQPEQREKTKSYRNAQIIIYEGEKNVEKVVLSSNEVNYFTSHYFIVRAKKNADIEVFARRKRLLTNRFNKLLYLYFLAKYCKLRGAEVGS